MPTDCAPSGGRTKKGPEHPGAESGGRTNTRDSKDDSTGYSVKSEIPGTTRFVTGTHDGPVWYGGYPIVFPDAATSRITKINKSKRLAFDAEKSSLVHHVK